jgi:hypothetical protein
VLRQACDYWHGLPGELSLLVIALAGVGMLSLLVRRYRVAVLFLLALTVHWAYTFNYAIWDLYVFYIPGYVLLTLLAAAGAGWLVDGFHRLVQRRRLRIVFEPLLALAVLAGGLWPAFAPRLGLVTDGHLAFDYESFRADDADVADLHDFVSATVRSLPPSAIVFTDWDRLYPLYYAAHIEQGRTDLVFHETIPQMENNRLADSSVAYVRANLPDHPVFFSERRPEITAAGYRLVPVRVGPAQLYRVQPGG